MQAAHAGKLPSLAECSLSHKTDALRTFLCGPAIGDEPLLSLPTSMCCLCALARFLISLGGLSERRIQESWGEKEFVMLLVAEHTAHIYLCFALVGFGPLGVGG